MEQVQKQESLEPQASAETKGKRSFWQRRPVVVVGTVALFGMLFFGLRYLAESLTHEWTDDAFLDANVEPGSCVITDGWSAYPAATRDRYEHRGTSIAAAGLQAHEVLPAVHRVFSLVKRWVMGTMQGSVSREHVQAYFDEWVFRFNRRNSRSRGLLFHTLLR